MSGILDGQPVNAAASNASWLAKNGDDTTIGKIHLHNSGSAHIERPTICDQPFTEHDRRHRMADGLIQIGFGGTGQNNQTDAFNALSPLAAPGDLIGFDGTDNVRFPVGADGTALTADSGSAVGWSWQPSVHSLAALSGDITLTPLGPITISPVGQDISIGINLATQVSDGSVVLAENSHPPENVGSGRYEGSGDGVVANWDHVHEGTFTVKKSGGPDIVGTITLSEGANITLTQVGNDITIAATSGGGGALVVTSTRASPSNITAAGGIAFTGTDARQMWFIQGNGGDIDVTANPQIAAATTVGQELYVFGCNDSQTVKLENGTGLDLRGDWIGGDGDVLALTWTGSVWSELFRNN